MRRSYEEDVESYYKEIGQCTASFVSEGESNNKEKDVLVEALKNDVFDTVFSFFKPSELQAFRLVRRSWNAYIQPIQLRNLALELQWYVSNKLLTLHVAVQIDALWRVKLEDRWALIPKPIREAIERLNMSKPYKEFLVTDYPLLALMGRFISVDECDAMHKDVLDRLARLFEQFPLFEQLPHVRPVSEYLKTLLEKPWGVRMLAKKMMSPSQAANFNSHFVLDYFISESGLILLDESFFTIDQLITLSSFEDETRLKHLCSQEGIAATKLENISFDDILKMDVLAFIGLHKLTQDRLRASVDPTVNRDYYSVNPPKST